MSALSFEFSDKLIEGLFRRLPASGTFTAKQREDWLQLASRIFDVVYSLTPDAVHSEEGSGPPPDDGTWAFRIPTASDTLADPEVSG